MGHFVAFLLGWNSLPGLAIMDFRFLATLGMTDKGTEL